MATPHASLARLLDVEYDRLRRSDGPDLATVVPSSIHRLACGTRAVIGELGTEKWLDVVQEQVDPHPIVSLLAEDPYTARARNKPRGYAGDAVMMDYCYFTTPPESASELGRAIFFSTTTSPNARSVVGRLNLIATRVDQVAKRVKRPNVLALACGHLREAASCSAFHAGRIGRWIALDQDEASLEVVKARYASYGIECVNAKIKSILTGELIFSDLDLIYAAGLFDYLDDEAARQLVARAFGFLRSGGQLLVGNFLPDTYGRGYMEAFMKWPLVVRTKEEIIGLADRIAPGLIASKRYVEDDNRIIGYVVLTMR